MQKNRNSKLYPMTVTGLLTAISLILAQFSVMIPFFGYPSVRFSVSGIPLFIAGSFFGPLWGACAGFVSDIIGFMLTSKGAPYHPGFTLNSIMVGLIPGLIFMWIRRKKITYSFHKINAVIALVALVAAIIYINFIGIHELEAIGTVMGLPVNIVLTVLILVVAVVVVVGVYMLQKHFEGDKTLFSIDKILFTSILSYIVIHMGLTPIWLNQLYGIPVSASIFVRCFKMMVDVPLQATVLYIVVSALPMMIKGEYSWKN